jgi:CheY-like chemotaxis protein
LIPQAEGHAPLEGAETGAGSTRNTICVCEDYPSTLLLVVDLLEREGFEVAAFPNADRGLSYLEGHASSVRMLLTDVRMPGNIDGLALARITAEKWPWIRIVIASGVGEDGVPRPDGAILLPKPWRSADLIAQVHAQG